MRLTSTEEWVSQSQVEGISGRVCVCACTCVCVRVCCVYECAVYVRGAVGAWGARGGFCFACVYECLRGLRVREVCVRVWMRVCVNIDVDVSAKCNIFLWRWQCCAMFAMWASIIYVGWVCLERCLML